jgi:Mg2+/Co2+ transporter CorB
MEAVLLSTPTAYLKSREGTKKKGLKKLIAYKQIVDRPLSAILSLNTVAHTVGAAGVGAQATIVFGDEYFGLVSAILTILILVLTEIYPKTIGANNWSSFSNLVGHMLSVTIIVAYPLVVLSSFLTRLISAVKASLR